VRFAQIKTQTPDIAATRPITSVLNVAQKDGWGLLVSERATLATSATTSQLGGVHTMCENKVWIARTPRSARTYHTDEDCYALRSNRSVPMDSLNNQWTECKVCAGEMQNNGGSNDLYQKLVNGEI